MRLNQAWRWARLLMFALLMPIALLASGSWGIDYNSAAYARVVEEAKAASPDGTAFEREDFLRLEREAIADGHITTDFSDYRQRVHAQAVVPALLLLVACTLLLRSTGYGDLLAFLLVAAASGIGAAAPAKTHVLLVGGVLACAAVVALWRRRAAAA